MNLLRRWPLYLLALIGLSAWLLLRHNHPSELSMGARGASSLPDELRSEIYLTGAAPRSGVTSAFQEWSQRYLEATPVHRLSLLTEGTRLANEHRARMRELIMEQPQAALAQAIPMVVRQDLPPEITRLLEQRVNGAGFFGVLGLAQEGNATGQGIRRFAEIGEQRYEAYVYGRRAGQRTTERMNFVGVAVDGKLAVDESPLRELEPGERPDPTKEVVQTCPVSGKSTVVERDGVGELPPVSAATPAVEVGGQITYLCHGGHILAMKDGLVAQEGGTGGAAKPTGTIPSSWTTGPRKVLYIRAIFPDNTTEPQSEADAYTMMKSVSDFMAEVSYGKCYFLTTVTPLITLPHTLDWYNYNNTDGSATAVLTDSRAAAREAGFDASAYDLYATRYNGPGGFSGQAYVGGAGTWLKSSSVGVAAHEFGHNLGLWHANFWDTAGISTIGAGHNLEYGHSFDTLGSASAGAYHFNAQHRTSLSWLPSSNYTTVTASGVYRIYQIDQPMLNPAWRYALSFRKDAQRTYWCEFRQKFTANNWLMNGLQVCWGPWGDSSTDNTSYGSNAGAQLLDLTPGSPDGRDDSALVIGKTFSDREAGIHWTPLGKGGTTPESIDVQVNFGFFPADQAPVISALTASNTTPATGTGITLTATATDGDADTLAYAWDFGDKTLGANNATVTKSWSTAGNYLVRCEVSDMKGKIAVASLLVTVGTPTSLLASGTVLDEVGAPMVGVRVWNGSTGTAYRGCLTDSNGNYTVTNLAAGYSLLATLENWSFVATGANFTGTAYPTVTLTAPDDTAVEAPAATMETGTYRFARSGPVTSALVVRAQLSGGAFYNTDYTLSPAPTSNLGQYYFTIPAGQPTLDVVLTPSNDSALEGPETALMTLVPTTAYASSGSTGATITINDLDTSLPVVSIVAVDNQASELGDPATLTIRRTGDTNNALTVTLGLGAASTATNGVDFPSLPTTISIPSEATETMLTLTPTNDALNEGSETAVISLISNAAYIRDPAALDATVQISDDDTPTVTIAAMDATGAEANQDAASFLVTRTGATTTALQVEYVIGGTALQGVDYASLIGTLTIPVGQASAPIMIYPLDDNIGEPNQTVIITLRSEPKYLVGSGSATVTLADNDLPMISIVASDAVCAENADQGAFRITSSGTGSGSVTVNYTVTGTAVAGTDYTALTGSVSVAKAGGSAVINLVPLQDSLTEDAESVIVTLTPDAAYGLSLDTTATILINDDEQPMVSVAYDTVNTISEGSTGGFYISRAGSTAAALTVNFTLAGLATPGTDYTNPGSSVTIPAGGSGVLVALASLTDGVAEGTENVTLTLTSNPGSYGLRIPSAIICLTDSQINSVTRTMRFSTTASSAAETAGTVNLPVVMSTTATTPITVDYAISSSTATGGGVDYVFTPGTLVFAPGETTKTIPVSLVNDPFVEPAKNVVFILRNCLGAARITNGSYTLTITSEDISPEPIVSFATAGSSVTEGPGATASVPVVLSSAQTSNVTVDYAVGSGTAGINLDYTGGAGTLTFAPGQTVQTISVPLVDDTTPESTETLTLTLSNPSGAALSTPVNHIITIADDDQAFVSIAATDTSMSEAGPDAGSFTITRSGNLTLALNVSLTVSGTATSGIDYVALPATVAMAPGETTAEVLVTSIDDLVTDPNETITVSLFGQGTGGVGGGAAGSGNYVVSTPSSAQLTLVDNENSPPLITVISPTGGKARLPNAQEGLILQTQVTDDGLPLSSGAVVVSWSKFSGSGIVTFDDPAQALTGVAFSQPGDYVLRLTASDGEASTVQDIFVSVEPVPWLTADVGDASSRPGTYAVTNGVYTVTGAGSGSGASTTDGHYFMYRLLRGDGEMIARVTSIGSNAGTSSRCGVMMRASTVNNVPHAMAGLTSNRISFVARLTNGATGITSNANITGTVPPRWVRVVRSGTTFKGYIATDTTPLNWVQQGATQTISMTDPILVGLSVTNASATTSVTAGFDNVQLITPNLAPVVAVGADAFLYLPQALSLTGQFSDDAKPAAPGQVSLAWSKRSGPGNVAFADPASANTTVSFSATGTYVLRLQANDGQSIAYDEMTVVVADPVAISVTAATTAAAEQGLVSSAFTISRATPSSESLAVNFSLTGSAANGVDYAVVAGSVIIPANATDAMVTITPLADTLNEGAESVSLTLTPQAAYQITGPASASLTIEDQPMANWKQQAFGIEANNPAISGTHMDPDADGLDNLVEYALMGTPLSPGGLSHYQSEVTSTSLSLTYEINAQATDVNVTPLWSADLNDWFSTDFTLETLSDTGPTRVLKATLPVDASHPRRLLKAQVTQP